LAPTLRVGYVCAPQPLLDRLITLRAIADGVGDGALEHAVAELCEDGDLQRHARRMRRSYLARRAALASALEDRLADALSFSLPAGGMALWATVRRGFDVDAWASRALERGVRVGTAREFALDGRARPYLRLAFASLTEQELGRAVDILAATCEAAKPRLRMSSVS
jgi:GntR family transcriptional regulator / MocR family aminotransferase